MSAGARRIVLLIGALTFAMVAWWGLAAPLSGFAISPSGMLTIRGNARRIAMAT